MDAVELPGVDVIVEEQDEEDPAPQSIQMYDPDRSDNDPPLVETNQVRNDLQAPEEPTPAPTAAQAEPQATRRSTRIINKPSAYKPGMQGSRYSYAVTQLETKGYSTQTHTCSPKKTSTKQIPTSWHLS